MKAAALLFESMLGEARLSLHKMRRSALESILASGLLIGVFLLMLFGAGLGLHLPGVPGAEQLAIGFVTWRFATAAYGSIAVEVADDIHARCLEQLAIGGGLLRVYLLRAAVHLIAGSVGTLFMLLVVAFVVDASLLTHAGALLRTDGARLRGRRGQRCLQAGRHAECPHADERDCAGRTAWPSVRTLERAAVRVPGIAGAGAHRGRSAKHVGPDRGGRSLPGLVRVGLLRIPRCDSNGPAPRHAVASLRARQAGPACSTNGKEMALPLSTRRFTSHGSSSQTKVQP